jgi:hypothetical protein
METLVKTNRITSNDSVEVKTNRITSNDSVDLVNGVKLAIATIKEKIAKEDWRTPNITINSNTIDLLIGGMTLNQRKKLKNKINGCVHKQTIRAINTFLHFLHKHVYKEFTTLAPCVRVSEKEEKIKAARKNYVEARKLMMEYHKIYKEEKGDFYKQKNIK